MNLSNKSHLKERSQIETMVNIKLLYKVKNVFKMNSFILYCAFILKILGMLLISHSYDKNSDINVNTYIRKITACYNSNISCINKIHYPSLCIIIYILLIAPYVLFFLTKRIEMNNPIKNKVQKILIFWIALIVLFVTFMSQHIIEVLSYIIYVFIYNNTPESNLFIDRIGDVEKYIYLGLNSICILYLNVCTFYVIAALNVPFFSHLHTIQIFQNKWFKIFLLILFNSQALSLLSLFVSDSNLASLYIIFVLMFFLAMTLLSYYRSFFSERTILSHIFIHSVVMILISCLLEIYFYYHFLPKDISNSELVQKILIEILFSFVIHKLVNTIREKNFIRDLDKILFTKQKKISVEPFLYITSILLDSIKNNNNIDILIKLIYKHKKQCKDKHCLCQKSNFQLKYEQFDKIVINNNHLTLEQFNTLYKDVIAIIENEILNMVNTLSKMNKLIDYCQIIILYIEFVCYFSMNVPMGIFLIEKYNKKIDKQISFNLRFQLYQLKRHFIHKYKNRLKRESLGINLLMKKNISQKIENTKNLISYWNFFKYLSMLIRIQNELEKSIDDFIGILSLGKIKSSTAMYFGGTTSNAQENYLKTKISYELLVKKCKAFQYSHQRLINDLSSNFFINDKLINGKLCYLLSLYYRTICQNVPDEVSDLFVKEKTLDMIQRKTLSFSEKGFAHPIIISLEDHKTFKISYICKFFNNKLGYKTNELLGKDINVLLPKYFWAPHQIVMRNNILKKKNKYIEKEKFIIDKNGYYIPVKLSIGSFPTLNHNLMIVIDVHERSYTNNYSFIVLDEFGNFLTYSKSIESKFIISKEIIEKNKFNFFTYFNLNENIFQPFKKTLEEIEKTDKRSCSLHINRESLKRLGEGGHLDEKIKNITELTFIYDKRRLKTSQEKIKNWLRESQTDFYLLNKIELQDKLFDHYQNTSNYRSNVHLLTLFKNQLLAFKIKISCCDSTTFYYVSIFEVEDEPNFNFGNYNFVSSRIDDSRDFSSHLTASKKIMNVIKEMPSPPTFSNLMTFQKWNNNQRDSSFNKSSEAVTSPSVKGDPSSKVTILNSNFISAKAIPQMKKDSNTVIKRVKRTRHSLLEEHSGLHYKEVSQIIYNIDSHNHKGFASFYFSAALLCLVLFVTIIFYPFTIQIINKGINLFFLSISLRSLEYEILLSSSLIYDGCLTRTFLSEYVSDNSKNRFKERIRLKSAELLRNLNYVNRYLNDLNVHSIVRVFNEEDEYSVIKQGWQKYVKNSTLNEEVLFYHYLLEDLGINEGTSNCDLNHFLYGTLKYEEGDTMEQSEILIYYIIKNVLVVIIEKLNATYSEVHKEIDKQFTIVTFVSSLFAAIFIIAFVVVAYFYYIIFNKLINSNVKIIDLLITDKADTSLMYRLTLMKELIVDFSFQKCEEYEKHLLLGTTTKTDTKNDTEIEYYGAANSLTKLSVKMMKAQNNLNQSGTIQSTTSGNVSTSENLIINNSMNSSFAHLNKKPSMKRVAMTKAKKRSSTNTVTDNLKSEQEKNTQSINEEGNAFNYRLFIRKNLRIISYFTLAIIIFIIITIIILATYIYLNVKQIQESKKILSIGISYISSILIQLLLSLTYKITILLNDPYQNKIYPKSIYNPNIIENYYKLNIDLSSSIYNDLDDTLYPFILYMYNLNRADINQYYTETGTHGSFENLKVLINEFNSKNFCVTSTNEFFNRFTDIYSYNTIREYFEKANKVVLECKLYGGGFLSQGMSSATDAMVNEMNVQYKEFMIDYRNNVTNNIIHYLLGDNISRFLMIFDYPYDKAEMVIINEVKNELSSNFNYWKKIERIFIVIIIIFDIIVITSGFYLTHQLSIVYDIFYNVAIRIKDALRN